MTFDKAFKRALKDSGLYHYFKKYTTRNKIRKEITEEAYLIILLYEPMFRKIVHNRIGNYVLDDLNYGDIVQLKSSDGEYVFMDKLVTAESGIYIKVRRCSPFNNMQINKVTTISNIRTHNYRNVNVEDKWYIK